MDVLVVGDQIGSCFAGTSVWFCWPNLGCDEVNRLFVAGIYHNYAGRRWTPLLCPGQILRCVHSQNIEIEALLSPWQWVLISRRRKLLVLWLRSGNWYKHPKSHIKASKFHRNRHGYTTSRQNIFSVIYYDYVIKLYKIENRYFLQVWSWPCCYHISRIYHTKFQNILCDILENMVIWVAVLPRVDQLTKVIPNFWRAVYIRVWPDFKPLAVNQQVIQKTIYNHILVFNTWYIDETIYQQSYSFRHQVNRNSYFVNIA